MARSYPQPHDSARLSVRWPADVVLQTSSAANATNVQPRLTETHLSEEVRVALNASKPRNDSAQEPIDPLIIHARFINEAAALDRALAMRKALRPARSEAARKGWEARRG